MALCCIFALVWPARSGGATKAPIPDRASPLRLHRHGNPSRGVSRGIPLELLTSPAGRQVFPEHIAERLKSGEAVVAEAHECVTVLFSDIVGFTRRGPAFVRAPLSSR